MKLGEALRRVGAQIARESVAAEDATFFLRVDPAQGEKWVDAISAFLTGSLDKKWTADVSKYFFVQGGSVKYLWRVVITGEVQGAMTLLGSSAVAASVAHAPQLDSFPLVGQVKYAYDPAAGKIKGGHELDKSPGILNAAIAGGGT